MKKILPTNDLAFKKVLASDENKDIIKGFIKDFFFIEPEEITIENPYNINNYKEIIDGKEVAIFRQTQLDVKLNLKILNFTTELQIRKTKYFDERSLYYPLERYCSNYSKQGEMKYDSKGKPNRYSSLKPIFAFNILGYTHFNEDEDALRIFELYDPKRNKRFNKELLKIGFFELTKKKIETENHKHWYDYFNQGIVSDKAPNYIKRATEIIDFANLKEEEKKVIKLLEKAQADYDAGLVDSFLDGKTEGKIEGKLEGKLEGKIESVINAIKVGLSLEQTSMISGFSIDEIDKIITIQKI